MEKTNARRNQIIKIIANLPPTDTTGIVASLFEPLKKELTSLFSEEGFNFIFERSVFLTCRQFPWLGTEDTLSTASLLPDLQARLAQQEPGKGREASVTLLVNATDLVASLIGEHLTIDILRSAWGNDALGSLGKEFQQ
jgi:hypothetical protein